MAHVVTVPHMLDACYFTHRPSQRLPKSCIKGKKYFYKARKFSLNIIYLFAIGIRTQYLLGDFSESIEFARQNFALLAPKYVKYFQNISRFFRNLKKSTKPNLLYFSLDLKETAFLGTRIAKHLFRRRLYLKKVLPASYASFSRLEVKFPVRQISIKRCEINSPGAKKEKYKEQ